MSSSYEGVPRRHGIGHPLTVALILSTIVLAGLRLCHVRVLWIDEDYHLAAALNMLHGKLPYRDFWYDKPPLAGLYYLLIGAHAGWPLRLLDAAYVLLCSFLLHRLASRLWSATEGLIAAFLFAFSMAFYLPSAVLPFAADAILLLPHCAAVFFAQERRPVLAGLCCGIGLLGNVKAVFVVAACALWVYPAVAPLFATAIPFAGLFLWAPFREEVWNWGVAYAKASPVAHPLATAAMRTGGWLAFNGASGLGALFALTEESRERRKLSGWLLFSFAAVAVGARFTPHYFLQLLPPVSVLGARGLVLGYGRFGRAALASCGVLLLIPTIRFLPRYVTMAVTGDPQWADLNLEEDSRSVAAFIAANHHAGDTLLVWGYRPDIYVDTRLVSDSFFWDSQPLTGVPADRHLVDARSFYAPAARNRLLLTRTGPTWLVDGLGLMNPALRPQAYPELLAWLAGYQLMGRTKMSLIYRRK